MVWKKQSHHGSDQPLSYYQKLLPNHILSHTHQQHHHSSQHTHDPSTKASSQGTNDRSTTNMVTNSCAIDPIAASASVTERPDVSHATNDSHHVLPTIVPATTYVHVKEPEEEEEAGGHDSPNWSRSKSFTILFACTVLYSIIAEVLVDTVDGVMENLTVDEKFLGLTLFALVLAFYTFFSKVDSHAYYI